MLAVSSNISIRQDQIETVLDSGVFGRYGMVWSAFPPALRKVAADVLLVFVISRVGSYVCIGVSVGIR